MVERVFRIMSNSEEYLRADIIAMALLKQITINPTEPDVVFGVMDARRENSDSSVYKEYVTSQQEQV